MCSIYRLLFVLALIGFVRSSLATDTTQLLKSLGGEYRGIVPIQHPEFAFGEIKVKVSEQGIMVSMAEHKSSTIAKIPTSYLHQAAAVQPSTIDLDLDSKGILKFQKAAPNLPGLEIEHPSLGKIALFSEDQIKKGMLAAHQQTLGAEGKVLALNEYRRPTLLSNLTQASWIKQPAKTLREKFSFKGTAQKSTAAGVAISAAVGAANTISTQQAPSATQDPLTEASP